MNKRDELLKRKKELAITQMLLAEEIVIAPMVDATENKIRGVFDWLHVQQSLLPVIEY